MGNKAAGGPFQLEIPSGEAPGFHVGAMSGNAREEGCAPAAVPGSGAADASDGSGDDERAYASPAEAEDAVEADDVADAPAVEARVEDTINFTRNNSQSSISNNRLPGSPAAEAVPVPLGDGPAIPGPATADGRPAESVFPPPPPEVLSSAAVSASASASVPASSPPRVPGGNDLQLPPLNDPHPLPGSEESARLAARGSPNSADGRDQKGAQ